MAKTDANLVAMYRLTIAQHRCEVLSPKDREGDPIMPGWWAIRQDGHTLAYALREGAALEISNVFVNDIMRQLIEQDEAD